MNTEHKTTDFGYQQIQWDEKINRVRQVFDSVADKYDVMNDLMSFGLHRLWKQFSVEFSLPNKGDHLLDLAGGTGDIAKRMVPSIGPSGKITVSDINPNMLKLAEQKLKGLDVELAFVVADAEQLPFEDQSFDLITMAFGLRNVTDKQQALKEMKRCLKPGGKVVILEFSKVKHPMLSKLYDVYSFKALPVLGKLVAQDADSYRYLAESIRKHPDQLTLKSMLQKAGFNHAGFINLSDGIVAIHYGYA